MEDKATSRPPKLRNSRNLELLRDFQVHPSGKDALYAYWQWRQPESTVQPHLRYAQIFYLPEGSSALRSSPPFEQASTTEWQLQRLHADTHYRVCIRVLKRSNFSSSPEDRMCTVASTQLVHMRASIGSSVGAILALAIIVIIVLLTQKRKLFDRPSSRRDSKRRNSSQKRSLWSSSPVEGVPCSLLEDDPVICYDPEMMSYFYCDIDPKCFDGVDSQKAVLIPVYDDELETESPVANPNKTVTFQDSGNGGQEAGGSDPAANQSVVTDEVVQMAATNQSHVDVVPLTEETPDDTPGVAFQAVKALHSNGGVEIASHEMTSVNVHRTDSPPQSSLGTVPESPLGMTETELETKN